MTSDIESQSREKHGHAIPRKNRTTRRQTEAQLRAPPSSCTTSSLALSSLLFPLLTNFIHLHTPNWPSNILVCAIKSNRLISVVQSQPPEYRKVNVKEPYCNVRRVERSEPEAPGHPTRHPPCGGHSRRQCCPRARWRRWWTPRDDSYVRAWRRHGMSFEVSSLTHVVAILSSPFRHVRKSNRNALTPRR